MPVLRNVSDTRLLAYSDAVAADMLGRVRAALDGPDADIVLAFFELSTAVRNDAFMRNRIISRIRRFDERMPDNMGSAQDVILMLTEHGSLVIQSMLSTQPWLAEACKFDPKRHVGPNFPYAMFVRGGFNELGHRHDFWRFLALFRSTYMEALPGQVAHALESGRAAANRFLAALEAADANSSATPRKDLRDALVESMTDEASRTHWVSMVLDMIRKEAEAADRIEVELGLLDDDYPGLPRF